MDFYKHPSFLDFSNAVKESNKNNSNLLLLSVPGMSVTFYIKKFIEHEKNKDYLYIASRGEGLSKFNFLDLNYNSDKGALDTTVEYLKKAEINQKFALVINTPYLLDNENFKSSILGSHFYITYFFRVLDKDLVSIFASILKVQLTKEELERVLVLSGGLTRIVKFLLTNKSMIVKTVKEIVEDSNFKRVFLPTANVIKESDENVLERLGIVKDSRFVGEVCQHYFRNLEFTKTPEIQINKDLTFSEKEIPNSKKLLKMEKQILDEALANNGIISKEKIAEYKWGAGSYDNYSDQAIKKTMQRINLKLNKYKFQAIRSMGYGLEER